MRTIIVDEDNVWVLSMVVVPTESPVGVIDRAAHQLNYCRRSYHQLADSQDVWMDIESGEIVEILWPWSRDCG
tara:strand:- start:6837 stop:7055 length:219 start_codon:yes stop_codon:yes gene_type:complete